MRFHPIHTPALARFDPLAFVVLAVLSTFALVEVLLGSTLPTAANVLLVVGTLAVGVVALILLPFGLVALVVWMLEK